MRKTSEEQLKELVAAVRRAFSPDGCACIKDMPGDNYTCTAHELLYRIARGVDAR
jgi:hypothetical protein